MLCQHCNQNEATVHLQVSINGQEQEVHLCADCAQALEQQYFGQMRQMMWPLMGTFFQGMAPATAVHSGQRTENRPNLTGAVEEDLSRRRQLSALKSQLSDAVSHENYEQAAKLRDEISRLNSDT